MNKIYVMNSNRNIDGNYKIKRITKNRIIIENVGEFSRHTGNSVSNDSYYWIPFYEIKRLKERL